MPSPKVEVRVPVEQRDRWAEAAAGRGVPLGAWIREVCDDAAADELSPLDPDTLLGTPEPRGSDG